MMISGKGRFGECSEPLDFVADYLLRRILASPDDEHPSCMSRNLAEPDRARTPEFDADYVDLALAIGEEAIEDNHPASDDVTEIRADEALPDLQRPTPPVLPAVAGAGGGPGEPVAVRHVATAARCLGDPAVHLRVKLRATDCSPVTNRTTFFCRGS